MSRIASPAWTLRSDLDVVAAAVADMVWRRARERADEEVADALARIAALVCLERSRGHAWVSPSDWAGRELPIEAPRIAEGPIPRLPDAATWERAVAVSALVGDGTAPTPLVTRDAGSVALRRDDAAERRLATAFAALLQDDAVRVEIDADVRAIFGALFVEAAPVGQALAAAAALSSRLCVITGGPGTGKTTTVVRVLALLLGASPDLRIAVCAPTGKAAARLARSLDEQREKLPVDASVRGAIPREAVTVHRLLGYRPDEERFARDAGHPLDVDVVVVDEASMLDLGLMDALVAALPAHARLILLGDRDQLASVDAGAVLADLVGSRPTVADARSEDFSRWSAPLFARPCEVDARADLHSDAVVELRTNFRFAEQPSIAALADALRAGDADAVLEILASDAHPHVRRLDPPERLESLARELDPLLDPLGAQASDDVAARLHVLERGLRVLTAVRRGNWGVEGLNEHVERRLAARGWDTDEIWYEGRPLLITRNAPELELHNGDLGVVFVRGDGEQRRRFAAFGRPEDGTWRELSVARLPEHETAWAMTVHKSQGSEFDRVVLVLPPGRHPLLSRELLYTGITRARQAVTVVADEDTLRAAVSLVERRRSGLASRLREALGGGAS